MAKGNRRLRSVVEGAMEASKDARRAAAAEKIRQSAATAPAPPVAPSPPPEPTKPKRTRKPKPETEVEPDMRLEATAEQRVPPVAPEPPQMTPEQAQSLRDVMLQDKKPRRATKPQARKETPPKPDTGFAPIRGPGALLGRLLKESYRQAPNIAANVVAIPAFTAAGVGGAYLGTAATMAAARGIGKLLSPQEPEPKQAEPLPQPDDYRSGFQRAIDERRKTQPARSGSDVIRTLSRTRGLS